MKYKKADIQKWIDALRFGGYKQTEYTLQDNKGFCCLGVACDIFIPKNKQQKCSFDNYLKGHMPGEQAAAPQWLKQISDDFYEKTGIDLTHLNDGTWLNDNKMGDRFEKFTFEEIADLIEAVYIKKVLK